MYTSYCTAERDVFAHGINLILRPSGHPWYLGPDPTLLTFHRPDLQQILDNSPQTRKPNGDTINAKFNLEDRF
jgi:hypothetical protein